MKFVLSKMVIAVVCFTLPFAMTGCNQNTSTGLNADKAIDSTETITVKKYKKMGLDDLTLENVNTPFFNDQHDNVVYTINAMWKKFGTVTDGTNAVNKMGNEPTYYEWIANKLMWCDDESYKAQLKTAIRRFPQTPEGYMWSWGDKSYWLVQNQFGVNNDELDAVSYHYDGTFRYIGAVHDILVWENSLSFLDEIDDNSALDNKGTKVDAAGNEDASKGKTVRQKIDGCMNFILEHLNGKNGIIVIPSDSNNKYANNTGKPGSNASNYWDNFCYGNYDAYNGALFYNTLIKMAGIEKMCGNHEKADYYLNLSQDVKKKYDEYYWNPTTGRYLNTIDTERNQYDYGMTFQNLEALYYGLGDSKKANSIFDWLDGKRIVETDTSKGSDIYHYKLAPRTNTVSIGSMKYNIDGKEKLWWHAPPSINAEDHGNAGWDKHQTNGGMIFFTEYYDLMSRIKYLGVDNAMERLKVIANEYEKDRLMRKNGWQQGIINEFPENGMVPVAYLHGILGITATYRGLEIKPNLPREYDMAGVDGLVYGGNKYTVTIKKNRDIKIEANRRVDLKLVIDDGSSEENYLIELYDNHQQVIRTFCSAKVNGELMIDLSGSNSFDTNGYILIKKA